MKWKLTLAALFLVGIGLGTFGYFSILNPPDRNVAKEKPAFELTADQLYDAFTSDEAAANTKFLDQVVQLSGTVSERSELPGGRAIIRLEITDLMGGVSGEFAPENSSAIAKKAAGDPIVFKGICTGSSASDDESDLMAALGAEVQLKSCVYVE